MFMSYALVLPAIWPPSLSLALSSMRPSLWPFSTVREAVPHLPEQFRKRFLLGIYAVLFMLAMFLLM